MKKVKSQDILSMKLMHYFICNKNYKPIIVNGVENEIWLENDNENYRIIRIVLNKIINMEQYELDLLKIDNILSQVKRKTLSISVKAFIKRFIPSSLSQPVMIAKTVFSPAISN